MPSNTDKSIRMRGRNLFEHILSNNFLEIADIFPSRILWNVLCVSVVVKKKLKPNHSSTSFTCYLTDFAEMWERGEEGTSVCWIVLIFLY